MHVCVSKLRLALIPEGPIDNGSSLIQVTLGAQKWKSHYQNQVGPMLVTNVRPMNLVKKYHDIKYGPDLPNWFVLDVQSSNQCKTHLGETKNEINNINHFHAEFLENLKIYLQFLSFPNTEMAHTGSWNPSTWNTRTSLYPYIYIYIYVYTTSGLNELPTVSNIITGATIHVCPGIQLSQLMPDSPGLLLWKIQSFESLASKTFWYTLGLLSWM